MYLDERMYIRLTKHFKKHLKAYIKERYGNMSIADYVRRLVRKDIEAYERQRRDEKAV